MDKDIEDICRLAGIIVERTEQTFDVATHERLMELVNDDMEFLNKLGSVMSRILAPEHQRQMGQVLQNRMNDLKRLQTTQNVAFRKDQKSKAASDAYADTDSAETNQVGGNINTRA